MSSFTPQNQSVTPETYTLDQLAEFSDLPVRTIRYYIQRGMVSRPEGAKKGAHYHISHLEQLLQIRKWVSAGMSLDRVAVLLRGEIPAEPVNPISPSPTVITRHDISVYTLGDGINLHIDPIRCPLSPLQISHLLQALEATLNAGNEALSTKE